MKTLISLAVIFLLAGFISACKPGENQNEKPPEVKPSYPDPEPANSRCYKQDGWVLYINYRAPGTRSEGIDGRIYHNAVEIRGSAVNATLDTPLGKMTWKGEKADYPEFHPWDSTGWYSDNPEQMRAFDPEKGDKKIPLP
jgi:hypothetical protein